MRNLLQRIRLALVLVLLLSPASVWAQQTTGGIQGTVQDSSGGVLPGVAVTLTELTTGRAIEVVTNDSGLFVVRSLPAGDYEVRAELQGFKTLAQRLTVFVGQTATPQFTLAIGEISEVVTVAAQSIHVDTASNVVTGTVDTRTIEDLPLNGRNFLDLAQTQPGAQLVDGGNFDPTKNQLVGISVGGRSGRNTRIEIDGVDISDETVGTTMANLSPDAMQEFQLSQSTLDPSTSIGSSGAVNIITKSGGNELHGGGFIFFRDSDADALPTTRTGDSRTVQALEDAKFDRQQGGGSVGGPIVKDKLFFFLNTELVSQDGSTFISLPNFSNFNGSASTPFNDYLGLGRVDWVINDSAKWFGRFNTETNDAATGFGGTNLAPFVNKNVTNVFATGIDVATATLTHSARYGFTDFNNDITTNNLGLPEFVGGNGVPVSVAINNRREFFSGPNRLAPQSTKQTNHQFKYDGAWIKGNHTFRYGAEVNWIKDNVFASFFGVGPEVRLSFNNDIRQAIIDRGGDPLNPLEYPVSFAILGNGQGSFSEIANNGEPLGGINNTRVAWYVGDTWKVRSDLSVNLAVRYELDTGQVNDDLALPPELIPLLGRKGVEPTRLDQNNFAPQVGFAWQPFGDDKTVIRGGGGLFYESQIFNNSLFDRTDRLPAGLGFNIAVPPFDSIDDQGRVLVLGNPVNNVNFNAIQGQPLANVINQIAQTQAAFQSASAAVPFDPSNPNLIVATGTTSAGPIFTQDFSSPLGIQTNIGFQQQLGHNFVLQADLVRNRSNHSNIVRDVNRFRAADNFDAAGARGRVQSVLAANGFSSVDQAIAGGISFSDFRLSDFFGTDDPNFSSIDTILTSGRSTYTAAQIRLTGTFNAPFGFSPIHRLFMNISYAGSRFNGAVGDQDFISGTQFNDDFLGQRAFGPAGLDRTHILSAQFYLDVPWGVHLNVNQRWSTALPTTLFLTSQVGGNEEIFFTDLDGDGTTQDFLTGTHRGQFGRGINGGNDLNKFITAHNSSAAGTLTPAAQQLAVNGLFTVDQLRALGVVVPTVPLAPGGQVENDSFLTTDVRISKTVRVGNDGRVQIEPMFEVFNLFNVANFGQLSGELNGAAGSVNGTTIGNRTNLLGLGSGSFSQGIPRALQFAVRVHF
ncbi:MAG: carboxypeptidase regulatory-like domain-containing protein [Acidobacteriota bacterium]